MNGFVSEREDIGMKIVWATAATLALAATGATAYLYRKKAFSLPRFLGLCGFPRVSKDEYRDEKGHYRPASEEERLSFMMQHPIFDGYRHMFMNMEDPVLRAFAPAKYRDFLKSQGREKQMKTALEAFNYLVRAVEEGQAELVTGIHDAESIRERASRTHLTGMLYHGQAGKPLAVIVPGGGFISNVTDWEGYPIAMALHRMGYSAFVVSYPIGRQLGEKEERKRGEAATKELTQVIRYLTANQEQLSIDMSDYAMIGFSAGGLMTTAFSFARYEDNCHKNHLPRPKVIFPIYGLDWNVEALPEDRGLSVFSVVGREDEFGFAGVENALPALEKTLGSEAVSIKIIDGLGHGFGNGEGTRAENWIQDAVSFWETHT